MKYIAIIMCLFATACITDQYQVFVPLNADPAVYSDEVQTAEAGEVFLELRYGASKAAKINAGDAASSRDRVVRLLANYDRPLYLTSSRRYPNGSYCAQSNPLTFGEVVEALAWKKGNVCLIDTDNDGTFDLFSNLLAGNRETNTVRGGPAFEAQELNLPIPYEETSATDELKVDFGLRYDRMLFSDDTIELVDTANGRDIPIEGHLATIDEQDLPALVEVAGIQIRVLKLSEGTMSYQIISVSGSPPMVLYTGE